MDNLNETVNPAPKPRTIKLAVASFVMGLIGILVCVAWPILLLPATICGLFLIIGFSFSRLKRRGYIFPPAVLGFLPFSLAILLIILMPAINKVRMIVQKDFCVSNPKYLGTALQVYTTDHNDLFPPADQWCDLLIIEDEVSLERLICPYSGAIEGESTYAININAAEKDNRTLPDNMVLLFETDAGIDPNGRTETIQNRVFFKFFKKQDNNWLDTIKKNEVYPHRWNLAGGPEIVTTRYHNDKGCNVLFVDGHSEYIPSYQIPSLRWTADEIPAKAGETADLPTPSPK